MASKTGQYLEEIRALDGLKNAILCGISVGKRDNCAEFFLVTDRTYSEQEERDAKRISEKYLPAEFSARVKIVKRVPDAQMVGDKIFEFIKAIGLEQKFLKLFPAGYVINILSKYNRNWQESMDNICEIVFIHVIGHIILGKSLTVIELEEDDYSYMQKIFKQATLEDIKKQLTTALEIFIKNYYENDRELLNYLSGAISGIVVRLKNAADNKVLGNII